MEGQQPQDSSSAPDLADILSKISSIRDLIAASSASHKTSIEEIFQRCQTEILAIIELIRLIDEAINKLLRTNASSAEDKQKLQAEIDRMNDDKRKIMEKLEELTNFQGAQSEEIDGAITQIETLPGKITQLKEEAQKLLDNINRTSGQGQNSANSQGPTTGGRKSRRLGKKGKGKGKKSVKRGGAKKAKKGVKRTYKGGFVWGLGKKKTEKKLRKPKSKKQKSRKGLF